jgi:outer membrane protein assembly factor BamB
MARGIPLHLARVLILIGWVAATGCDYVYDISISHYDPARACRGKTFLGSEGYPKALYSIDMTGNLLWSFSDLECEDFWDFEVLDTGEILYLCTNEMTALFRPPGTILWKRWLAASHHSVLMLPWENVLYLSHTYVRAGPWEEQLISDVIREMNPATGEIVWEWGLADHISPAEHYCPLCMEEVVAGEYRDWSHSNALHYYEQDSTILLNVRNLNTFLLLSYPSGDVLWACGDAGTFGAGLFHHPHDPELLPNGNVLMFDNDEHGGHPVRSRALELAVDPVAETAEVVWEWRDDELWAPILGDANRLPNGNTLVTHPWAARVIEVSPSGEKVWEMRMNHPVPDHHHTFYKAERIPD